MKVLYAITNHGFGHATRACTIAGLLQRQFPQIDITFSTAVPADAMQRFAATGAIELLELRQQDYEPGLIQRTCFELDAAATQSRYRQLAGQLEQRVASEAQFLATRGFDAVLSDVAAIPVAAAAQLGLPAAVIGNFSWDWILEPLFEGQPDLLRYLEVMRQQYRQAAMYFRLPLHAEQHPFERAQEAPLIGRRSRLPRDAVLSRLGISDDHRPLVLVAVGGWEAAAIGGIEIEGCSDYQFLVVGDLPISAPDTTVLNLPFSLGAGISFQDLVAVADAGVVKPGYGTCAEFIVNAGRMVGITRNDNREAPVLAAATGRHIPYCPLSLENFFSGNWQATLDRITASPRQPFTGEDKELSHFARSIFDCISH